MRRARMRQDIRILVDDLRFVSYVHKQRLMRHSDESTVMRAQ